jgi:acetolactate synthase-1/2/3 large subunit
MKAADWIVRFLVDHGVSHAFEVSGGMITHLLDSCYRLGAPKLVSVRHEQAAGFAAEGLARITGVPGVAMATSGPGATNLLTAVGSLYFDSYPAVFITGQVNRHELKGERETRQAGFQETDIVSMARPVTKAAWLVDQPERLPEMLREAFHIACAGRPGPVLLDIPMDVQRADIAEPVEGGCCSETEPPSEPALGQAIDLVLESLQTASRPLILAGGGIRSARVIEPFQKLVAALGIPVIHSLMAVDVLGCDDPRHVGMLGTYGNRWANLAVGLSDWLLVLGSRLDIRQTGADVAAFKAGRRIFHVDVEPGELNQRVTGCDAIRADLRSFLPAAVARSAGKKFAGRDGWLEEIAGLIERWPDTAEVGDIPGIHPNRFMQALSEASTRAAAFAVDVGQHQMWAAQSLRLRAGQRFMTSGGMGSMGFALPAAVGAAFGLSPHAVVAIAGDGGFQHNIQELQTVVHHHLPLKIVVIDNQGHGMVRQFQQSYFDSRYPSTRWGYSAPDFRRVAEAYGMAGDSVEREADLPRALAALWQDPSAPALLHVHVDPDVNVYPKIAFGHPFTEMEPLVAPDGME